MSGTIAASCSATVNGVRAGGCFLSVVFLLGAAFCLRGAGWAFTSEDVVTSTGEPSATNRAMLVMVRPSASIEILIFGCRRCFDPKLRKQPPFGFSPIPVPYIPLKRGAGLIRARSREVGLSSAPQCRILQQADACSGMQAL
jgi:hypothetical protein